MALNDSAVAKLYAWAWQKYCYELLCNVFYQMTN